MDTKKDFNNDEGMAELNKFYNSLIISAILAIAGFWASVAFSVKRGLGLDSGLFDFLPQVIFVVASMISVLYGVFIRNKESAGKKDRGWMEINC